MLSAIIIEEEKPAMELMTQILSAMPSSIFIKAKLHSVKDSIAYFSQKPDADLIFSDVRLSDGLSFDIFEQTGVVLPAIFITGYDRYIMRAFETNGIDYLLKPLEQNDVEKSIAKYKDLQSHFTNNRMNMPLQNLEDFLKKRKKTKLMVKFGCENISLLLENIVLVYSKNKLVYVIDQFSKIYLSDKTLAELEEELDSHTFFRANRQYIINVGFVKSFKPFQHVKLFVETILPDINHSVIISQETAPKFRKWMDDA
jgi:DNA-binding LytR/AlgR family response regulator